MSDNDRTYPMNKMEPDVGMGAVYAGPEMMDQARRAVMEQAAELRKTMDQQRKDDPLRNLKEAILDAGRYRSQPYAYDDFDGKTEEELREILKAVNDMPVTMFEDRAYNPQQQPPMMMVYAGPQQMSNGGFATMFQQQMKPQKREPEPGREVVGYCHDCGTPLYARSKFCPECGTQLKFLK